jgi:hypothetical protein
VSLAGVIGGNAVDHARAIIFLILIIALTVWRLIRYMKMGLARRPQTGVPGVGGTVVGAPSATPPSSTSPRGEHVKSSVWVRVIERTTAGLVFVIGNVLLWGCLFGLTALDEVPTILRLVIGVFVNFPLIRLAQAIGASIAKRVKPDPGAEGSNPFL